MIVAVLGLLVLVAVVIVVFFSFSRSVAQLNQNVANQLAQVQALLQNHGQNMSERLDRAALVFSELQYKLGELEASSRQIHDVGKNIQDLQNILRVPKIRGGMGEFMLEDLLSQVFPRRDFFTLQYGFRNGTRVDAVIKVGERLVPVDSKFPMENFVAITNSRSEEEEVRCRRMFFADVKKHITDIADKYILPEEGTFDFALMYIPAENVYHEAVLKEFGGDEDRSLYQYALKKRIIPVSPNSFYAYLQVILLGLRGLTVEKSVREVLERLAQLRIELQRFAQDFEKLGRHLDNARGSFEEVNKRLNRIQDRMERLEVSHEK